MGLQRHLKVAGIFARLTLRDGKPRYLADTPRFIAYIRATAGRYRELTPLLRLIDEVEGTQAVTGYRLRPRSDGRECRVSTAPRRWPRASRWTCRPAPRAMCRCCGCNPATRITLFNGAGGEFDAVVEHMGRSDVRVRIGAHIAVEREAPRASASGGGHAGQRTHGLAGGKGHRTRRRQHPAADRRTQRAAAQAASAPRRSRRTGRASPIAACEQCGRNRVPPRASSRWVSRAWLAGASGTGGGAHARIMARALAAVSWRRTRDCCRTRRRHDPVIVLSGPEGGLSPGRGNGRPAAGFCRITLGARVLRAETAPLAALSLLACDLADLAKNIA